MVSKKVLVAALLSTAFSANAMASSDCNSVKSEASASISQANALAEVINARQSTSGPKVEIEKAFHLETATGSQLTSLLQAEKSNIDRLEATARELAATADSTQLAACLETVQGLAEFVR